jgi:glycosyltransferase involved in cell wall biosynthesis
VTAIRIAVDARTVYNARRRGTGKNLVDLYRQIAMNHPDWRFIMFHRQTAVPDDPFGRLENVAARYIDCPGDRWDVWQHVLLPMAAAWTRASVLHAPANTAPFYSTVPVVSTIHDLIPLDTPTLIPSVRAWARNVRHAVRRASRVITPSTYTKQRLIQELGASADKIVVNYWAPDAAIRRVTDVPAMDDARCRHGLRPGDRYIFGFGAHDPRKNMYRIIEAWAGLPANVRTSVKLLLVGIHDAAALAQTRAFAASLAPDGGWSLMPFAADADIPTLMSGAAALCYPSLGEGFGLPVLDAFVCGAPVITSNTTSLPEVTGDAGLLVDPTSVEAIRDAMLRVATDEVLAETLRRRGFERVKAFTWDRCARTVADVLAEAA